MSFFSSVKSFFKPNKQQQVQVVKAAGNKVPGAGGFMQHYKDVDSFKKGGPVKKTGLAYLHKGEYVLNPRMMALIKSGEGPKKKGYEQTYKTVPKKKYDWDASQKYREKTGFYRTKIDGGGHTAGYHWAKKTELDPKDRKRKYGANSPSFDEGVREYKRNALKNKMK